MPPNMRLNLPGRDRKAMKAFVVDRYNSKSAVRLGEMPEPEVRDDDVLVQVRAASLNQLDSKIRDGEFKFFLPYRLPLMPRNLTMEEAASIPLVGLTAWQVLIERANLNKGQKVLIHAGSGGVGTFAIQLAKHVGAIVATTTSTANVEWVKRLGADIVIDYSKDDFATILRDYNVVLNSLGGATLEK